MKEPMLPFFQAFFKEAIMQKITKNLLIITLISLTALTSGCSLSTMTFIRGTAIYRLIREFDKEADNAASAVPKEEWRTVKLKTSGDSTFCLNLPFDLEDRQQLQPPFFSHDS